MKIKIHLSSHDLSKLVHILEAGEGLAVLKTIDGKNGLAELIFPPSNQETLDILLKDLRNNQEIILEQFS